jgi:hypothetical protein
MIKTLKINGTEIKDNSCTSMTIRVFSKDFGYALYGNFRSERDNSDITCNQIRVMEWVNRSEDMSIIDGSKDDTNKYLRLETPVYSIVVVIPKGDD